MIVTYIFIYIHYRLGFAYEEEHVFSSFLQFWPSWKIMYSKPIQFFPILLFYFFSKAQQYYILFPYNTLIILSLTVGYHCCLNSLVLVNRMANHGCTNISMDKHEVLWVLTQVEQLNKDLRESFSNEKHKLLVTALHVVWHPLSLKNAKSFILRCHITQSKWMPSIYLTKVWEML